MNRAPSGLPVPHLRAWRLSLGLSQGELAEAAKVDPFTIRKIEQGESARFPTIGKLASALGLSRQRLLHSLPESEVVRA